MTRAPVRRRVAGSAFLAIVALLLLLPATTHAQAAVGELPSPERVLGYPLGEEFTDYHGVRDYARALAEASPLVEYRPYGESVEGRELIQLVIAIPEHHARLDAILAANAELTRLETTPERARQIAESNPAIVYFSYGVHGNESSSSEAALWTAFDLAAADPSVAGVLDSVVVIIDPVTNPDGRERYVQWYRSVAGATPNPDPETREHQEPWPGGRYNHYLFDLNRDWAWMTQAETQARLATWWRWNPQVHVDFHEMGPNSTYFFFPASPPINPIYPEHILAWGRRFGEANARAFDSNGWHYFTGESYDMLYPGYGDSWPSLLGAIGMTYEQAGGGGAGLAYLRPDGDTLTLHDRATHHRTSGGATLRTAAAGKTQLLLDFAEAHRTAGAGASDILLVPGEDPSRLDALLDHLVGQGIEVEVATRSVSASATPYRGYEPRSTFPSGTALVRARQPRGRLALTLLQPETELIAEYSYDISAWSLPYAYGVEAHLVEGLPRDGWVEAAAGEPAAEDVPASNYGYLVEPSDVAAPAIVRYLEAGGAVRALGEASTFAGREWLAGTWYLPASTNVDAAERVREAGLGALSTPVRSGLSERGNDLGSPNNVIVTLPEVGLLGGDDVDPTSYGAHWYYLEKQLGLPFDALLLERLPAIDLSGYDVLILPDTRGTPSLGVREALQRWIETGGRLVAMAGGAESVAGLANIEVRQAGQVDLDRQAELERLLTTRQQRERESWLAEVPGAILEVRLDPGHPLTWGASYDGIPDRLFVLHVGGRTFEPAEGAEVAAYFPADLTTISGSISDENLARLQRGAWLISRRRGAGEILLFADDPLFRLFWKSTIPLYRNALLLGSD